MGNLNKMPTPEDMAKIQKTRTESDAKLIKGSADYVVDEKSNMRLDATKEQKDDISSAVLRRGEVFVLDGSGIQALNIFFQELENKITEKYGMEFHSGRSIGEQITNTLAPSGRKMKDVQNIKIIVKSALGASINRVIEEYIFQIDATWSPIYPGRNSGINGHKIVEIEYIIRKRKRRQDSRHTLLQSSTKVLSLGIIRDTVINELDSSNTAHELARRGIKYPLQGGAFGLGKSKKH